jgi:nitroreductase
MKVQEALVTRVSANKFDTADVMTADEVQALIAAAMEAPSAFNIQHARFLVVRDPQARAVLQQVAKGQPKVREAAATVVVLGDLRGAERLPLIAERAREAGLLDAAGAAGFAAAGQGAYADKPAFARDEAIRSASMAAMALMLAATARGLASGPMIGFDPEALRREFNIDARYLPVMLIAVGRPAPGNWPRKPRLRVNEVLVDDARPGQVHAFS